VSSGQVLDAPGTTGDDVFVNVVDYSAFSGLRGFHIDIA